MKCSQLPWFKDEGWVENHVSISSPDHGAIRAIIHVIVLADCATSIGED